MLREVADWVGQVAASGCSPCLQRPPRHLTGRGQKLGAASCAPQVAEGNTVWIAANSRDAEGDFNWAPSGLSIKYQLDAQQANNLNDGEDCVASRDAGWNG